MRGGHALADSERLSSRRILVLFAVFVVWRAVPAFDGLHRDGVEPCAA